MKKSPLQLQTTSKKKEWGKDSLVELLRRRFGHAHFRGSQLQAIEAVLSGRDCFCLMPTGGGKSMCYQIPALAKQGIVIVELLLIHDADAAIFLTALMENQVIALKEKKIPAEYLASTLTSHAKNKIYEDLESGKPSLRLLYVTPEMMATAGFMSKLTRIHSRGLLNVIAIDEAHCISTWGHDFSIGDTVFLANKFVPALPGLPSYRRLSSLRTNFPGTPLLALTATAVLKVQNDVMQSLGMQNPLVLKSSFNRVNIYYEVRYKDILEDAYADLLNLFKSLGNDCAIVYCLERTTCDYLSTYLVTNGISCAAYHARLNDKVRSSVLDNWLSARIQVVVATVAFGLELFQVSDVTELYRWFCRMGIDRKDVRLVCHFNIPKSMEAFYQESGRAGRDQLPCRSILYYGINDRKRMEFILANAGKNKSNSTSQDGLSKKSLADFTQMVEYCEQSDCRRKKILESFGEQVPSSICKNLCDTCKHPSRVARYLEELTTACATQQRNSFPHIMMTSPDDFMDEGQSSEFWNCADETSGSEEDISYSDDIIDDNCPTWSKFSSASELNDRMEFLQRAEEKYYKSEFSGQQMKKLEKNAISKELRDAQKQRLSTAISQALHRLGPIRLDLVTSASTLESVCFRKYGKSGKSFYLSQVASTIRWLLTTDSADLMNRLETKEDEAPSDKNPCENIVPETASANSSLDHGQTTTESKEVSFPQSDDSSQIPCRGPFALPPIPSFSQFTKRRKAVESKSGDNLPRRPEKKTRL